VKYQYKRVYIKGRCTRLPISEGFVHWAEIIQAVLTYEVPAYADSMSP